MTIVQRPKQLMNPFDADMASFIHSEMRKHGVRLALGYTVEGFEEKDGGVDIPTRRSSDLMLTWWRWQSASFRILLWQKKPA